MRILVVDDEPLARERIVSLIQDLHAGTVVGQAANGIEALEAVHGLKPDIVLLDIRMPGMDGMETAHHLARTDNPPAVLFATAYDDHAVDAFEASAADYLLKPVRKERLQQSLDRAAVLNQARMAAIKEAEPLTRTHLSAIAQGNLRLIPLAEIRYFQAGQKYVTVGWSGGYVLIEESLKSLETEFSECFLRIHRNALVALEYIEAIDKDADGNWLVRLHGVADRLAVSRRHLSKVRKRLRNGNKLRTQSATK